MRLQRPTPRALFGSRANDGLQRRMRHRLFRLFTMLMLVLAFMQHASNPANWNWFWKVTTPADPVASSQTLAPAPSLAAFDPESAASAPSTVPPPILDASLLNSIRDDTYFHPEESEAWFQLFASLRDRSPAELQQASLGPASYLQLYRQTDFYRGHVVELRGTLRRAHALEAPANQHGVSRYWQCWIFPEPGGASPIVVYSLDLPEAIGEGMTLAVPVTLHACVYKRWAYARGETMLVAPVVLAATIQPLPSADTSSTPREPSLRPRELGMPSIVLGCVALVSLAILAATLAFRSSAVAARSRPPADLRIQAPTVRESSRDERVSS